MFECNVDDNPAIDHDGARSRPDISSRPTEGTKSNDKGFDEEDGEGIRESGYGYRKCSSSTPEAQPWSWKTTVVELEEVDYSFATLSVRTQRSPWQAAPPMTHSVFALPDPSATQRAGLRDELPKGIWNL